MILVCYCLLGGRASDGRDRKIKGQGAASGDQARTSCGWGIAVAGQQKFNMYHGPGSKNVDWR